MDLEQQLLQREKQRVVRRYLPDEVLEQVQRGNKFIVVDGMVDLGNIPQGYTLIDMKYKGDSFKTLVPTNFIIFYGKSWRRRWVSGTR